MTRCKLFHDWTVRVGPHGFKAYDVWRCRRCGKTLHHMPRGIR